MIFKQLTCKHRAKSSSLILKDDFICKNDGIKIKEVVNEA